MISPQEHGGFGDGDTCQPGGKGRAPFEFAQMGERFLKALLYDVLGVFPPAGNAPRNEENPLLVTFDQDLERLSISALLGVYAGHVSFAGNAVARTVDVVRKFRWHSSAPCN